MDTVQEVILSLFLSFSFQNKIGHNSRDKASKDWRCFMHVTRP